MERKLRIFTVAEANALLPELTARMSDQFQHVRAVERLVGQLRVACGPVAPTDLRPDPNDDLEVAELKLMLRREVALMRASEDAIAAMGGMIADVRGGLVDFYGRRNQNLIWLCWRYGEPTVRYWHRLDEGGESRRPVFDVSTNPGLN